MKIDRHAKIIELIARHSVETQEELTELLREVGISVTQATVSRDIRELKLIKVLDESGGYKYASYEAEGASLDSRIVSIFREAVLTIDYAGHTVCIHTITGMANAAAVAVDMIRAASIIGCVAGDDTIFVLVRTPEDAAALADMFKNMMKKNG